MASNELELSAADAAALDRAVGRLERNGFVARVAEYTGEPINRAFRLLPRVASDRVNGVVKSTILKCLDWAVGSLGDRPAAPSNWLSTAMAGVAGGVGGAFGLLALPVELPLTTTLILRSIAAIARHHGEDLTDISGRLACIEVFALGGRRTEGATGVGYYAARALLARLTADASARLTERGLVNASAPAMTGLLGEISSRYSLIVSDKLAAEAVPIIGAVGGAAVNVFFMDHFQRIAEGHFTVRQLERRYGVETIQRRYAELARRLADARK